MQSEFTALPFSEKAFFFSLHQGAVEGCCIGFTKFCASLLSSSDAEIRDIPARMLKQVSNACLCPFFPDYGEVLEDWFTDVVPLLSL